jgi:uncharacterized membrane protein (UPF0127 family)
MTDSRKNLPITCAVVLLFVVGCNQQSTSGLRTVSMQLGNKTFTLEVADHTSTRTYGLMRRDSMPSDHGMIFVFKNEAPLSFWMENTRIPLDIVYIDAQGKVVSIKQMKPYDRTGVPSDGPVKYAIELNKGAAEAAGIQPGMSLKLPDVRAKD